jgi:hypothetical protein
MAFRPTTWFPIATLLSVINVAAVGFAAGAAEPWHATTHAGLGLAFGLWAYHLRQRAGAMRDGDRRDALEGEAARLGALESDMSQLRHELSEAQERLDFAERLLAQGQATRRVGPES